MTFNELYTVLSSTNIPVAYDGFPESSGVNPPCIVYNQSYTDNFGADDKVFAKIKHINIHLYTKGKDLINEALVENALDGASLFWNSTEAFDADEQVNHIIYEVKIHG